MKITFALAKGRLADQTIAILEKCGLSLNSLKEPTRKLVLQDDLNQYSFFFVKPSDVPTYVEYGIADVGVVGKDTLLEEDKNIYELLDLNLAKCKLCIAGYKNVDYKNIESLRVATKYINIAKKFFIKQQKNVELIKLNGSIELAPVIGLADVILDIVESGKTLKENDLSVLEEIFDISARLVVNKVSLKTKGNEIRPLVDKIKGVLKND